MTNCNHRLMLTCQHVHMRPHCLSLAKRVHVDWNWPISREKYLNIDWSVKMSLHWFIIKAAGPGNGSCQS